VRVRADKQYDLIDEGGSFVWHKTIVDNRCFRPMPTVVRFNAAYEMIDHEITGGHYITPEEYDLWLSAQKKTEESSEGESPAEGS
jgi:hypothetical protein